MLNVRFLFLQICVRLYHRMKMWASAPTAAPWELSCNLCALRKVSNSWGLEFSTAWRIELGMERRHIAAQSKVIIGRLQGINQNVLNVITQPSIYGVIVYFFAIIPPNNKYDHRLVLYHGLVTRFPGAYLHARQRCAYGSFMKGDVVQQW